MHIIYNPYSSVYVDRLYQQVIAEESMKAAVEHVKKPSLQVERLELPRL